MTIYNNLQKNNEGETQMKNKSTNIKKSVKYLIILLVVLGITNPNLLFFLPKEVRGNIASAMSNLLGDVTQITKVAKFNFITIFQLVVMILIVLLINSLAQFILSLIKPKDGRATTVVSVLHSIIQYAAVLVAVFWGLAIVGVNVSTIFASVGILALIISFGAENLIADVITGLFMLIESQYQVGDIIEVDGFRGVVSNIAIRTTSVTDMGDNVKIINNSDMRNIINLSNKLSVSICDIGVGYDADLEKVRKLMGDILPEIQKAHAEVFPEVPTYMGVQELGDSQVLLRVRAQVKEKDRFTAVRILNEELKIRLEKNSMPVPFPQVVIHKEA